MRFQSVPGISAHTFLSNYKNKSQKPGPALIFLLPDTGTPLPRPPPPAWVPGHENRAFRGVQNKGGIIEKFIVSCFLLKIWSLPGSGL